MIKYYCDLCKKEIRPLELRIDIGKSADNLIERDLNFHSECWKKFCEIAYHELTEEETAEEGKTR